MGPNDFLLSAMSCGVPVLFTRVQVSALLNATAYDLVDGGKLELFTPSYFFVARKK